MKKQFCVELSSPVSKSFRCQKAADSLDIDVSKKLTHKLTVEADIETPFSVGLIVGASGSGKTTLAQEMFGEACFTTYLDLSKPVIDQFPKEMKYDDCADTLTAFGLSSVPCWIRPAHTLSNGQRARAEAALALALHDGLVCIDEWTSVVDRTVAKVMSHCIQKAVRSRGGSIVLVSCHYDVVEWLDPDWIIDCNKATYEDRRSVRRGEKADCLTFDVQRTDGKEWKYFSKYHYLSDKLPTGRTFHYGLFHGENQIGYLNYANYIPKLPHRPWAFHFNRLVIHPDYVGFGLGIKLLNIATQDMLTKLEGNVEVWGSFSSVPVFKALTKDARWELRDVKRPITSRGGSLRNSDSQRTMVTTYSFKYVGRKNEKEDQSSVIV